MSSVLLLPTQKYLFYGKAKPFVSCPKKKEQMENQKKFGT